MSYSSITKFNHLAANQPSMGTDYEYWQQLRNQAKRIHEEALELLTACEEEDMVAVLDGFCDVRYTNEYMDDLLKAGDVQTDKAWQSVCDNNMSKFTQSYTYAVESKEALEEQGVECYVESCVYEGETYYCVKRNSDNKILKPRYFESVDLTSFVPKNMQ